MPYSSCLCTHRSYTLETLTAPATFSNAQSGAGCTTLALEHSLPGALLMVQPTACCIKCAYSGKSDKQPGSACCEQVLESGACVCTGDASLSHNYAEMQLTDEMVMLLDRNG